MVAQAVGYEPVSHVNSLLTGNFTGKTVIFGFGNRPLEPETPLPRHFGANSLIKLTGKRFRRTGILVAPSAGWSVPSRNSVAGNGIFGCGDRAHPPLLRFDGAMPRDQKDGLKQR